MPKQIVFFTAQSMQNGKKKSVFFGTLKGTRLRVPFKEIIKCKLK